MLATRVLLVLALLAQPCIAQEHNVQGRRPEAPTGCAGSPDLSDVNILWNWQNGTCSSTPGSPDTSYTTETDTGDWPDAVSLSSTQYSSPDLSGIWDMVIPPYDGCGYMIDHDGTNPGAAKFQIGSADWTYPGDSGTVLFLFRFDQGVCSGSTCTNGAESSCSVDADCNIEGAPGIVGIGNNTPNSLTNNGLRCSIAGNVDFTCSVQDTSGDSVSVSTSNDTTSTCCSGGTCSSILTKAAFDDVVIAVEFRWAADGTGLDDTGQDAEMFINGCKVDEAQNTSFGTMSSSTYETGIGQLVGGAGSVSGDWEYGTYSMSIVAEDLTHKLSGGDDDFTNGNECDCNDFGGGTACGS